MSNIYNEFSTLVNSSVIRALKACGWSVEQKDAVQIGWEALLLCLQKRDARKGVGFYSYARLRVYGAVLDAAKKQTKLITKNGIKKRVNNTPMPMDNYDERTIDEMVGYVETADPMPNFAEITKNVSDVLGKQIIYMRFYLDYSMKEIRGFIRASETCTQKHYFLALNELKKDILQSDYRE